MANLQAQVDSASIIGNEDGPLNVPFLRSRLGLSKVVVVMRGATKLGSFGGSWGGRRGGSRLQILEEGARICTYTDRPSLAWQVAEGSNQWSRANVNVMK